MKHLITLKCFYTTFYGPTFQDNVPFKPRDLLPMVCILLFCCQKDFLQQEVFQK